jgi:Tfp pilus assembly protein PilN
MGRGGGAGPAQRKLNGSPYDMRDIDFLPVQYRQKHVQRRSQPWRIVVVTVFAVLLSTAVFSQQSRKMRAQAELAAIGPQYDLAVLQDRELANVYKQLNTARSHAELYTYLRYPWPRTQLLTAVLKPLPEEVTIEELKVTRGVSQDRGSSERRSRPETEGGVTALDDLPPAARDLQRLRNECDQTRTVVSISGLTSESAAWHRYLGELGRVRLFTKAEPESLQTADHGPPGTLQFRATLVVRPGYGQPGGPTSDEAEVPGQTVQQGG